MKVRILRQNSPLSGPYWESFDYNGPADNTVSGLLEWLNCRDNMVNDMGEKTEHIYWECSCLQGACGACAMVINGRPALACDTFLSDLKNDEIEIRPLRKFPVIKDLAVDRSVIFDNLKKAGICMEHHDPRQGEDHDHQYLAAKCLKCGLCLEVCPNYGSGEVFYGAAFANDCYLVYAGNVKKTAEIRREYAKHFAGSCSKSLACMDVCPSQIPTLASMAKLNKEKWTQSL